MQKSFRMLVTAILLSSSTIMAMDEGPSTTISALRRLDETGKWELVDQCPSLFAGYKECAAIPKGLLENAQHELFVSGTCLDVKLESFFNEMKEAIASMEETYPQLSVLSREIEEDIAAKRFELVKYYGYGLRSLAAISEAGTLEALSIFKIFGGDQVENVLRNNWQSPSSYLAAEDNDKTTRLVLVKHPSLSARVEDIFDKEAGKLVRPAIIYYLFNKGKLGLVTLIEAFIKRQYPIPMSLENQTAHGIQMTKLLFSYHDFVHAQVDKMRKKNNFYAAGHNKLAELTADKINADQIAIPVTHYMIDKAHQIEDALMELLDLYFSHYLADHGVASVKKSMVGFFEMMHESLNLTTELYDMDQFEEILEVCLDKRELPQEEIDILKTNPITGKTYLTSKEALEAVLAAKLPSLEMEILPPEDFKERKYTIELVAEPMAYTLRLRLLGGAEYSWNINTLKYELSSSLDKVGLLKIAGIKMTPPSEEALKSEDGRQIAMDYLAEVEKNMNLCTEAFKTSALELMQVVPSAAPKSLSQRFKERSEELKQTLQDAVSKID